jgi:DNA-directed RNA polymerase subunit beta'
MILTVLPVIPPEARPLIQLETGNFTSSDLNELYRLIIARNEKVKKMIEEDLPASVINNDKRLLQEAVDALLDNSAKSKPIVNKNRVALSSITDKMKGKSGLFRQNLLGKRVDYSGRSAIVAGPNLKLYEAGIPMEIILKMFKPFIIAELIRKVDQFGNEIQPVAVSPKDAEKMIQRQDAVI